MELLLYLTDLNIRKIMMGFIEIDKKELKNIIINTPLSGEYIHENIDIKNFIDKEMQNQRVKINLYIVEEYLALDLKDLFTNEEQILFNLKGGIK